MKRLNLLNTRKIVFVLLLLGLALLFLAAYAFEVGSAIRNFFIWSGVVIYLVVIVLMGIGFKCPKCGCRFFKAALFMKCCPLCGADFTTYKKSKETEVSQDVNLHN